MMISAFCVFRMANRHTFGAIFDRDLADPRLRERYRRMIGDMVVDYLAGRPAAGPPESWIGTAHSASSPPRRCRRAR